MKILLTGGTGFLGQRLVAFFAAKNYKILLTKRKHSNLGPLHPYSKEIQILDLDTCDLSQVFKENPDIDGIVHAATDYGYNPLEPIRPFWANESFPIKLLEVGIQHYLKFFINLDTFFNQGKADYNYLKSYTLSKRHFQEWGKLCGELGRIAFVNLRLFHMYGPNDNSNKFIPHIISRCLAAEEIDLTAGMQKRDFIYVDDVVSAIIQIMQHQFKPGYYHFDVGTGISTSIRDVVQLINQLCGGKAKLKFGILANREKELMDTYADNAALVKLGWSPRTFINEGLLKIIQGA